MRSTPPSAHPANPDPSRLPFGSPVESARPPVGPASSRRRRATITPKPCRPTSRPASPGLRILSLGAGVQSSTLLLMSLAGELPRLDAAVFADTGWEPRAVYAHLARLETTATAARLPVYRVRGGDLRDDALDPRHRFASMPLHVRRPDGRKGLMRRQCTAEYKVTPIRRKVRALWQHAGRPRGGVEQWLGISADEAHRIRDSGVGYITHRYPLIERDLTRADCHTWLRARGWKVPRSACIGCPFRSNARWRELRDTAPEEFADAVAFDHAIRHGHPRTGATRLLGQAYLHHTTVPLGQADLDGDRDADGFGNECQGVCAT